MYLISKYHNPFKVNGYLLVFIYGSKGCGFDAFRYHYIITNNDDNLVLNGSLICIYIY